ncbi:MAG: DUF6942 family protein [Psychromonas sp.]
MSIIINQPPIGFGDKQFTFAVYIGNQPAMLEYESLTKIEALSKGDIEEISKVCGNGWRKVFNVYAKLLYALDKEHFTFSLLAPTWQSYRDDFLLQENSQTALIFSAPNLSKVNHQQIQFTQLHIICGRTYAKQLIDSGLLESQLVWLDEEFAIDVAQRIIVCPYFDYRQLSNIKIKRLSHLLNQLMD